MRLKKKAIILVCFLIILIILIFNINCNRDVYQVSNDISESKSLSIFITKYDFLENPYMVNKDLKIKFEEAWLEKAWGYSRNDNFSREIYNYYQLCLKISEDTLSPNYKIGIDSIHSFNSSKSTSGGECWFLLKKIEVPKNDYEIMLFSENSIIQYFKKIIGVLIIIKSEKNTSFLSKSLLSLKSSIDNKIYERNKNMNQEDFYKSNYDNSDIDFSSLSNKYNAADILVNLRNEILKHPKSNSIDLSNNEFIEISPYVYFLNLLKRLNLSRNNINTIHTDIQKLKFLEEMNLSINRLSKLPIEIGNLKNLKYLDLSKNIISAIPDTIRLLSNLKYFDISKNNLHSFPLSICFLENVHTLILDSNKIKTIPQEISQMINLKYLYLSNNQIEKIPESLVNLENLRELYLDNNYLTLLPNQMGKLKNLELLYLSGNKIKTIPSGLSLLKNLIYIELSGNPISPGEKEKLKKQFSSTCLIF